MEGPLNHDQAREAAEAQAYQMNLEALVTARTEQLRNSIQELERSYDTTIETLGDALRLKDADIAIHSRRVCAFATAIGRAAGVSWSENNWIARGAFLHDIGMLAVPETIHQKPGPLTADETARMREHCNAGYRLLDKIPVLREPAKIVYAHHERYDGTGYPRGLKGDQIPIGARICAVAETLDAVMSDRPYRKAQSLEAARAEINKWSGRQFDPEVVRVFLDMNGSVWQESRSEVERNRNS